MEEHSSDTLELVTDERSCFKSLTSIQLNTLLSSESFVNYKKGETIIKQGTRVSQVMFFESGLSKLFIETPNYKNLLVHIINSPDIIGGPDLFYEHCYSFSVEAITDTDVYLYDLDVFRKLFMQNDKFGSDILNRYSSKYTSTIQRLAGITYKNLCGRIAEALLYFSDAIYHSDKYYLNLSRQELSEFTSMSKESVSRVLGELSVNDIVAIRGRTIEIKDKFRLKKLCDVG